MHLSQSDAETIGTCGIYFFTALNGYGLSCQIRTIWRKKSGQSIPVGSTLCILAMFAASIPFGLTYNRQPIVVNASILGLGFVVMTVGLWKFRGFRSWERWFGLILLALLVCMVLTGHYDRWYFGFNIGAAISLTLQPWEIWRNRSAGAINIRSLLFLVASNSFWVIYAYATKERGLMILCPIYLSIVLTTVTMWWIFRPRTSNSSQIPENTPS